MNCRRQVAHAHVLQLPSLASEAMLPIDSAESPAPTCRQYLPLHPVHLVCIRYDAKARSGCRSWCSPKNSRQTCRWLWPVDVLSAVSLHALGVCLLYISVSFLQETYDCVSFA